MNLENQKKEFTQKLSRINGFIERNKLDGLALSRQDNFAWATGGSSNWVNTGSETGVAILLFRPKGSPLVVLNNIEAPRLSQEENLLELGFEIIPAPWWQGGPPRDKLLLELVGGEGKQLGIDHSSNNKNFKEIKDLLAPERYILTPEERQRYRKVGQETARCLEELVSGLTPGLTEQEIAGKLAASIYSAGLVPLVTLVAVDERIFNFRHPTPTNKRLKKYAEVVICARGGGLIASCTRLVHFGPLSNELKEKQTATQRVEHKTSKVVLVGHSMGSAIALVYALTYPDKLAGLVLAGGGANLKVNTSLLEALQNDFPTAVEFVVTHSFSSLAPEELRTSLRETWHDIPREVTLDDFLACNQYDVSGELNRLKNIPVLVITGAADVMTPPRLATRLAEGIPGAKLEFLDAAGHMLMQEKPQEFNRAIDQFLGSLPG